VWVFEGTLERVIGGAGRFAVVQRVAWPAEADWEEVRAFGHWMVERLSINGHVLVGLRARPEGREGEGWLVADRPRRPGSVHQPSAIHHPPD